MSSGSGSNKPASAEQIRLFENLCNGPYLCEQPFLAEQAAYKLTLGPQEWYIWALMTNARFRGTTLEELLSLAEKLVSESRRVRQRMRSRRRPDPER